VCRQAGYFEHAAYLAKRWSRHEDYLRIQIEDTGNFTDALAYLRHLGPEAVSLAPYFEASVNRGVFQTENNLARYGRAMVAALPDETTQLLIEICTGTDPLVSAGVPPQHPRPLPHLHHLSPPPIHLYPPVPPSGPLARLNAPLGVRRRSTGPGGPRRPQP